MNSARKRKYLAGVDVKQETDEANFNVLRIILPHLSFHDQHRLGLTCRTLYHTASVNCRAKLSYHRRRLDQSDFELAQRSSNPRSWAFYRGLVWLNEDMSKGLDFFVNSFIN